MKRTFLLLLAPLIFHAEDWPQFRGVNGTGISTSKNLPTEFSADNKVSWRAKLGDGVGSPIVMKGRVFTTAMVGERKCGVFAFDAASGKALWKTEFDTGTLPRITPPNSHASSTPAADAERVYVHFSTSASSPLMRRPAPKRGVTQC